MTYKTFDQLWEASEQAQSSQTSLLTIPDLISTLKNQLTAYQVIDQSEMIEEAKQRLKQDWMGDILLTLCQVSAKDNINTFSSLQNALEKLKILELANKHQTI